VDVLPAKQPGTTARADKIHALVDGGFDTTSPFAPESYDSTALLMLSNLQARGSSGSAKSIRIRSVGGNAPAKRSSGELAKRFRSSKTVAESDYDGRTAVGADRTRRICWQLSSEQIEGAKSRRFKYALTSLNMTENKPAALQPGVFCNGAWPARGDIV